MTVQGYSRLQIALHWGVAVLIAVNLVFEDWIKDGWDAIEHGGAAVYGAGTLAHIGVGVAVLVLALWRVALRVGHGVPDLPESMTAKERMVAHMGHGALYALMLGVPLVGLAAWFGASEDLAEVHEMGKPAFLVLIAAHAGAVLWHQFVKRDGLLDRMRRAG